MGCLELGRVDRWGIEPLHTWGANERWPYILSFLVGWVEPLLLEWERRVCSEERLHSAPAMVGNVWYQKLNCEWKSWDIPPSKSRVRNSEGKWDRNLFSHHCNNMSISICMSTLFWSKCVKKNCVISCRRFPCSVYHICMQLLIFFMKLIQIKIQN